MSMTAANAAIAATDERRGTRVVLVALTIAFLVVLLLLRCW